LTLKEIQPPSGHPVGRKVTQIVGSGFDTRSKVDVMFGDKPARAIVVAKDRIQIESPPGKEGEVVDVTVRFPDGRSAVMPKAYRWETPRDGDSHAQDDKGKTPPDGDDHAHDENGKTPP
jgi:hypothetical protein